MSKTTLLPLASVLLLGLTSVVSAQTPAATRPAGQTSPPFTQPIPPAGPTSAMAAGTTQSPRYELSAGYQMLHVPDETFPFGLNVDGARNFGAFGAVAEIGWSRKSENDSALGSDVTSQFWHFAAGPRWSARRSASIWPFAQVLAGAAYNRVSTSIGSGGGDISTSATKFMLQPGAGAVFIAGDGWGIIGQADYRRVFLDEAQDGESGQNDFRVFIGVRMILD